MSACPRWLRIVWWNVRFASLAMCTRLPFEHPRVQRLVAEHLREFTA